MSTHVEVVTITRIDPHPNADRLEIAYAHDYPVVVGKGQFEVGTPAVYIPVDSVLPDNDTFKEVYAYTHKGRVRAARIRGQVSMGLLWPVPPMHGAESPAAALGITRYEEPVKSDMGHADAIRDPGYMPKYDIENLLRWPGVLWPDEAVVITEKLHGANARFLWHDDQFWVGSRNLVLNPNGNSVWNRVADRYGLFEKLAMWPGVVFYGEILGVQDLRYGVKPGGERLALFDAYDVRDGLWCRYDHCRVLADYLGIEMVPLLYRGPWKDADPYALAEGQSILADHVREGVVIRPAVERTYGALGRVILKLHGQGYLLRKEAA